MSELYLRNFCSWNCTKNELCCSATNIVPKVERMQIEKVVPNALEITNFIITKMSWCEKVNVPIGWLKEPRPGLRACLELLNRG